MRGLACAGWRGGCAARADWWCACCLCSVEPTNRKSGRTDGWMVAREQGKRKIRLRFRALRDGRQLVAVSGAVCTAESRVSLRSVKALFRVSSLSRVSCLVSCFTLSCTASRLKFVIETHHLVTLLVRSPRSCQSGVLAGLVTESVSCAVVLPSDLFQAAFPFSLLSLCLHIRQQCKTTLTLETAADVRFS